MNAWTNRRVGRNSRLDYHRQIIIIQEKSTCEQTNSDLLVRIGKFSNFNTIIILSLDSSAPEHFLTQKMHNKKIENWIKKISSNEHDENFNST